MRSLFEAGYERRSTMANLLTTRRPNRLPALWRRDPITALREEMNELRAKLFGEDEEGWFTGAIVPSLDLSETEKAGGVRIDLPGITAKDIDVQVSDNVLTVSGKREEEKEEKGRTVHRVDRSAGGFGLALPLPSPVKESEVAAEYH